MTTPPIPGPPEQAPSSPPGPLLKQPVLVMQQISSMMSNDFDITTDTGETVGHVETTGALARRFFLGSRHLNVRDADGTLVVAVADPVNLLHDTYELTGTDGQQLATVRRKLTFVRTQANMELADGTLVELRGNVFDFNFEFRVGDQVLASVTRQWTGLGNAFLDRSTYAVVFEPGVPGSRKAAMIGGVVALDLIRRKDKSD